VIDISKGDADINVVLRDILALTKLNYNTRIFGDGMPITLKFADPVGEILTAGPIIYSGFSRVACWFCFAYASAATK
jgi:hypothetical protein